MKRFGKYGKRGLFGYAQEDAKVEEQYSEITPEVVADVVSDLMAEPAPIESTAPNIEEVVNDIESTFKEEDENQEEAETQE